MHVSTLYSFYNYQYSNNYGVSFGKYFKCYYFSFLYPQKYTKQLSFQIHMLFLIVCHLTLLFPGAGSRRIESVSFLHAYHHSGVFLPDSQFPTAVYGLERGFYSTIQPEEWSHYKTYLKPGATCCCYCSWNVEMTRGKKNLFSD